MKSLRPMIVAALTGAVASVLTLTVAVPASAAPTSPNANNFRKIINVTHNADEDPAAGDPAEPSGGDYVQLQRDPVHSGCAYGNVCLYTDNTEKIGASHPHTHYYYYGFDNLSDVTGNHYIYNNQKGGARLYLCRGYDGTKCTTMQYEVPGYGAINYIMANYYGDANFTPINSVVLCAGPGNCPYSGDPRDQG